MFNTDVRIIPEENLDEVKMILSAQGLQLDRLVEVTFGAYDENSLIGTASVYGSTIRSVAVRSVDKGGNSVGVLLDTCLKYIEDKGFENAFIFTNPLAAETFSRLGFHKVGDSGEGLVLMERSPVRFQQYLGVLKRMAVVGRKNGCIVMNANPFTLGHQYLAEEASHICDHLYIWVVKEEASAFPYADRLHLVKEGTRHLRNVTILEGSDYIVSKATFPSYFSKSDADLHTRHATLDLAIFAELAKALKLNYRFVGTEPYCEVTKIYNETMKRILPEHGVEVIEIQRRSMHEKEISASDVRKGLLDQRTEAWKSLVPSSTYDFLVSDKGTKVIAERLKYGSRH